MKQPNLNRALYWLFSALCKAQRAGAQTRRRVHQAIAKVQSLIAIQRWQSIAKVTP